MAQETSEKRHSNGRTPAHCNRFPLTLHPTGQYCKKIHGRIYYSGRDKQEALRLCHQQATSLHMGRSGSAKVNSNLSLRTLSNLCLDHQDSRATVGEISHRHFYDVQSRLREFAKLVGPTRKVHGITTLQVQSYRQAYTWFSSPTGVGFVVECDYIAQDRSRPIAGRFRMCLPAEWVMHLRADADENDGSRMG